jgi:hypothetical protein
VVRALSSEPQVDLGTGAISVAATVTVTIAAGAARAHARRRRSTRRASVPQWETAINELQSLASNNVWELVDAPEGASIVSDKWTLKAKCLPNSRIDRYKARLVARGFSQQYGVNYDEAFAPVVCIKSLHVLRVLLAIAAIEDLEVHQMDVITAYLAGELERERFVWRYHMASQRAGNKVCRLKKGLYGLKQSARVWGQRLTSELRRIGL